MKVTKQSLAIAALGMCAIAIPSTEYVALNSLFNGLNGVLRHTQAYENCARNGGTPITCERQAKRDLDPIAFVTSSVPLIQAVKARL